MNRPTDSVRIAIFDVDNPARFLVLAEADDPDNWKLPGGKFDSVDETPEGAANRELAEELQLDGSDVDLRRLADVLTNDDAVSARHIFTAIAKATQPNPSAEVAAIRWITAETVPEGVNRDHILSAVALATQALT